MSLFQSMGEGYDMMCDLIIRPPRAEYGEHELGPKSFKLGSKRFQRSDFKVENKRGLKLSCSHFEPVDEERPREKLPCVIYMHGNCGCRLEAIPAVERLLPYNITVFAFDFSGCGNSEGEYISLGYFERDDVSAVVKYLEDRNRTAGIGLWGRSMGAATALMYSAKSSKEVRCIVADSSFTSLTSLAKELVENNGEVNVPGLMVTMALRVVRRSINKKAGFDLGNVAPIKYVGKRKKVIVPALFAHGKEDNFIRPHHSEELLKKYAGHPKNIIMVEGDHNSVRPQFFYDSVSIFFSNFLLVGENEFDPKSYEEAGSGKVSLRQAAYSAANPLDMYSGDVPLYGGVPSEVFDGQADEALIQATLLKSLQGAGGSNVPHQTIMGDMVSDDLTDEELVALIAQSEISSKPQSVDKSAGSAAQEFDQPTYAPVMTFDKKDPLPVKTVPKETEIAPPVALSDAIPDDMPVEEIMKMFSKQEKIRSSLEAKQQEPSTLTSHDADDASAAAAAAAAAADATKPPRA